MLLSGRTLDWEVVGEPGVEILPEVERIWTPYLRLALHNAFHQKKEWGVGERMRRYGHG